MSRSIAACLACRLCGVGRLALCDKMPRLDLGVVVGYIFDRGVAIVGTAAAAVKLCEDGAGGGGGEKERDVAVAVAGEVGHGLFRLVLRRVHVVLFFRSAVELFWEDISFFDRMFLFRFPGFPGFLGVVLCV